MWPLATWSGTMPTHLRLAGMGTAFIVIILSFCPSAPAATNAEIQASIDRGVAWLYTKEDAKGSFENVPAPVTTPPLVDLGNRATVEGGQWGGLSGISVYALLSCGETFSKSEKLNRAGDWLKEHENLPGTYAVSLRGLCWPLMGDNTGVLKAAHSDCRTLVNALKLSGEARGLTGYFVNTHVGDDFLVPGSTTVHSSNDAWGDHSSSLYDLLAVHALDEMGCEVPDDYWRLVDQTWRAHQNADGSWKYKQTGFLSDLAPNLNMTASGVAALFVCQAHLVRDTSCNGYQEDRAIEAGLAWIDQHYTEAMTPFKASFTFQNYGMYAVERVGLLSGRKYFAGTRNWYKDGCDMILQNQLPDGSWTNIPDTCFALLFLSHGRVPVVLNKLQYEGNWDERPRDAANVSSYMTRGLEQATMWQVVTLKAPVEDLHESPILYIAGKGPLNFTAEETDKLRQFVEEGGIILGNADCGDGAFAKSFKELGSSLWPDFEWEKIGADHLIFTDEQYKAKKWQQKPDLVGLNNGVRELMLLAPGSDPSSAWQANSPRLHEYAFQTIANIFMYSVDRDQEWNRGETYVVNRDAGGGGTSLRVARLKYNGYWNPEPGGWRQLANIMHNKSVADLDVQTVELGKGQLDSSYRIAHMTGVGKFKLNDAQKAEVKSFVIGGGTLIFDAAGGSKGFADSARDLLAELFPDGKLSVLPKESGIYAGLETVGLRRAAKRSLGAESGEIEPQILGLDLGGRTAAYLSPLDLSEGLVGQPVDGVCGYMPQTAAVIMSNMISGVR
jgi:hypothetical protein